METLTKDEVVTVLGQGMYLAQIAKLNEIIAAQAEELTAIKQSLIKEPTQIKSKTERVSGAYSELKSNGVHKARAADSIRSYDDFTSIQKYFLDRGDIRDWTLWTVGVCLGLRISDLLSLKVCNVVDCCSKQFFERIKLYEKKTGKLQNCLITEAARLALEKYFNSIEWKIRPDDYLFPSKKTGGKMYEEYGWKIISDAGKALDLPIHVGSHTMRKSFANIAACVDKDSIDMNAITKIQGLLNHSDQKTTMRYLGVYHDMFDRARESVSDFVLGKTGINFLYAGGSKTTLDDLMSKIEIIEKRIISNGDVDEAC